MDDGGSGHFPLAAAGPWMDGWMITWATRGVSVGGGIA